MELILYSLITMIFKITFLIIFSIIVRGLLPRYRIDQIITLNWKLFLFINLFCLLELLLVLIIISL